MLIHKVTEYTSTLFHSTKELQQTSAKYDSRKPTADLCVWVFFPPVALKPKSGLGDLGFELSSSHTIRQYHPVGLPWTSDRPVAETSK